LWSEDDKLERMELTDDDALLLSDDTLLPRDEAIEPSSLDSDEDAELPTDDALLPSEDAFELKLLDKLLDKLPPELLLLLFELLEHAETPKKTTVATRTPTTTVRERRSMREF
jgi:hypothetical protein